jgi:hypothetical protein
MADEKVSIEVLIKNSKASKSIKDLEKSIEALNDELSVTDKTSEEAFKSMSDAVDEATESMDALVLTTENSVLTLSQLEAKQGALSEALRGTSRGTEEFERLRLEIVQVNKELGNAELGLVGLNREDVAGAVGQLTGAVGSLTGAFVLLGGESGGTIEEIGESIQTAIGITAGFQGAIEGVEAGRKIWQNYQQAVKKSAILTKLMATAQAILNAVMNLNPVFLLIVAFGVLIGLFAIFAGGTNKAQKESEKLNASLKSQEKAYANLVAQLDELETARNTEIANSQKLLDSEAKLILSKGKLTEADKKRLKEIEELGKSNVLKEIDNSIENTEDKFSGLVRATKTQFAEIGATISATDYEDGVNNINYDAFLSKNKVLANSLKAVTNEGFTPENVDKQIEAINKLRTKQTQFTNQLASQTKFLGSAELEVFEKTADQSENLTKLLTDLTENATNYKNALADRSGTVQIQADAEQIQKNADALAESEKAETERQKRAEAWATKKAQLEAEELERVTNLATLKEELLQKELGTAEAVSLRKLELEFNANLERAQKLVQDEEELSAILLQIKDNYESEVQKINQKTIDGVEKEFQAKKEAEQKLANLNTTTLDNIKILEAEKQLIQADGIDDELEREAEKNRILAELDKARIEQIKNNSLIALQNADLTANERIEIARQQEVDIAQIKADAVEKQKEVNLENNEAQKELNAELISGALEVAQMLADASFEVLAQKREEENEADLERINSQFDAENEQLNKQVELGLKSERQAEKEREKIEKNRLKAEEKSKKEAFEKEKKASIAQAIINGALAILTTLASSPPPASYILAGVTAVATGIQIATISSQKYAKGGILNGTKNRFAGGGLLDGPSHSQGGIQTPFGEMEGGEAVINKRSTEMFRTELSQMNQAGGGVKFASGGVTNEVNNSPDSGSDLNATMEKLNETLNTPLRSFVVENDITSSQNRSAELERNADI